MRILFINGLYPPYIKGGGEISTHLLAKGLAQKKDYCVKVLTIASEEKEMKYEGVAVQTIQPPNVYWSYNSDKKNFLQKSLWHLQTPYLFGLDSKIAKVIRSFDPAIVETSVIEDFSDKIWKVIKDEGKKIVHTLRSYSQLCYNANMFYKGKNCDKQCISCKLHAVPKKILSSNVDSVIGISKHILDKHVESGFFPNAQKYVVPNIYDGIFIETSKSLKSLKIGYIGRIHPTKGLDLLIDSFKDLCSLLGKKEEIKLIIAGGGNDDYVNELKDKAKGFPIEFIGYTKPTDFYKKVNITICPSIWEEPFGRVVIESMAHGVPVIGSRIGGIKELIDNEETGLLFNSGSKKDLINKIKYFYNNKTKINNYRIECIKKSKQFSSDSVIKQHMRVIEDTFKND